MVKISIIVPVYNASRYIDDCIKSILSQEFKEFELLLIDDGSKDNSGNICDEYARQDSRVHVFHQPNQGVCVARNVGLENASGDWITFADADDLMLPNSLSVMYSVAIKNKVDLVMASTKVLIEDEEKISPLYTYTNKVSKDVLQNIGHPALWGYLYKASIISENHIRFVVGLAYSEDKVFNLKFATYCKSMASIPHQVYVYRVNMSSVNALKDGVKKAYHQFFAASEIEKLANDIGNISKRNILIKHMKELQKLGYSIYIKDAVFLNRYKEYEAQYLKFFNGRLYLFLSTLKAYIVNIRRKIMPIKDNPLTGKKGLLSIMTSFFTHK